MPDDSLAQTLRAAHKTPATVLIALAAVAVTLAWMGGFDITPLLGGGSDTLRRPWSLVTSIFPHVDIIHLVFNIYWWWYLATRLESIWGGVRLLALTVALAIISSGAEYALASGGVGLSGVVYGQFAMLWIVQRTDERFAGTISPKTAAYFVAWFLLCIALTIAHVWNVGNIAHGAGALAGGLIGLAVASRAGKRAGYAALAGVLAAIVVWSSTFGAGELSLTRWLRPEAMQGYEALKRGDFAKAVPLLEAAVRAEPNDAASVGNLGHAYQESGRFDEAVMQYKRAVELRPDLRENYAPSIASILARRAWDQAQIDNLDPALADMEEALRWDGRDFRNWRVAGSVRGHRQEWDQARSAFAQARQLASEADYPRWEHAYDLAGIEMRANEFDAAVRHLRDAIELKPERLDFWFFLGESLEALAKPDEAIQAYSKAAESPEYAEKSREAISKLRVQE